MHVRNLLELQKTKQEGLRDMAFTRFSGHCLLWPQKLISTSTNPNTSVTKIGWNSLHWFLRYCVHKVIGTHRLMHSLTHGWTDLNMACLQNRGGVKMCNIIFWINRQHKLSEHYRLTNEATPNCLAMVFRFITGSSTIAVLMHVPVASLALSFLLVLPVPDFAEGSTASLWILLYPGVNTEQVSVYKNVNKWRNDDICSTVGKSKLRTRVLSTTVGDSANTVRK